MRVLISIFGVPLFNSSEGVTPKRGLFLPWRGRILVVGLGSDRLIPLFSPAQDVRYGFQFLEFRQYSEVNFPRANGDNGNTYSSAKCAGEGNG